MPASTLGFLFKDDIAALTNSQVEAFKNQALIESFQHKKVATS